MDGVLIIDKPAGPTSHDVVARVRRRLKVKRAGHTGTLDPFATGVMVILVGRATRLARFLDKDEKEYEALLRFGYETDTGDRTGMQTGVVGGRSRDVRDALAGVDWMGVLNRFRGEIEQVPPMFSAKKVDGRKLYEHARKGEVVEREPVRVNISALEIVNGSGPVATAAGPEVDLRLRVACSAGTYIRTLAEDIGRVVGVGAHLAELRRTRAGRFMLADAVALEEFETVAAPGKCLLPVEAAVAHLPAVTVDEHRIEPTRKGMSTRLSGPGEYNDPVQMISPDGTLLAIGFFDEDEGSIKPKVVLG